MAQNPNRERGAASVPANDVSISSQGETQVAKASEGSQPRFPREQLEAIMLEARIKAQEKFAALSPEERRGRLQHRLS